MPVPVHPAPYLIELPRYGSESEGYLTVAEADKTIPFPVHRTFWTYNTPELVVRGRHAHYHTQQVLIAVAGRIVVMTETALQGVQTFILDRPTLGLYVPPHAWHTMQYLAGTLQVAIASQPYDEADYIRDYHTFRRIWCA
ncbi:sugar 3,4-ketoisomerase [Hymenobacter metallilatus]|uniref:WxcM-like domain-containing protein n=1 Tax=Hymenobacter metallilatus TaxID=2493666 RepID=A0A428JR06_9BACT|nr:FdtA/QdtA family cupin domain-containing protein [Hymenobacter metallilatus]RSK36033.1 WxcM-like domain-containing protein [Hymenobacter metallilatus]